MTRKSKSGSTPSTTAQQVNLDETFFGHLWAFYRANRGDIRNRYKVTAQKFLDYNENVSRFLRRPQMEALELYVFLKERLASHPVHVIFDLWFHRKKPFEKRANIGLSVDNQAEIFDRFDEAQYRSAFAKMKAAAGETAYANYIFALTMGTGKTLLMATCIFYDFVMAHQHPKELQYARNALIFAPDKTVLQSLREMESFDRGKVIPPEYRNIIEGAEFRFLEDTGTTLSGLRTEANIIVSNAQKIILKRSTKERSPQSEFWHSGAKTYAPTDGVHGAAAALLDLTSIADEDELITNQRFEMLRRMKSLGIFIDEAHHAFGKDLAGDLERSRPTSLRLTVDELARQLNLRQTRVVGCYNYTGTPYSAGTLFPEVVYAYGLKTAIDAGYLKKIRLLTYDNVTDTAFVRQVIADFVAQHAGKRFEGLLPKLAFFAPTIETLIEDLKPVVESELVRHHISAQAVLVNVGDDKHTSNDDIREFHRLDTPESEKQFILLVNKGKEGWNCRSLFGVALFRKPKSKVFVLQATMRCLRAIAHPPQQTGHIYLSKENAIILNEELAANFRVSVDELKGPPTTKHRIEVRAVPPPRFVKVRRARCRFTTERRVGGKVHFDFTEVQREHYRSKMTEQLGLHGEAALRTRREVDITHLQQKRNYSRLTLTAEISRYLNLSALLIESVLVESVEGIDAVIEEVSQFNEMLHGVVIPKLFSSLFEIKSTKDEIEEEVALVRDPEGGVFIFNAEPEDVLAPDDDLVTPNAVKSFHLDHYVFDSKPEKQFFLKILKEANVRNIYFTGMLRQGQSEFFIDYIDPYTYGIRHYYPDFLIEKADGTWVIVEVKGDNKADDPHVLAKQGYARELAGDSRMEYRMILGSAIAAGDSPDVLH